MNLNAIAGAVSAAITPRIWLSIQVSTGETQNADFTRTPTYAPALRALGSVQPMASTQIYYLGYETLQGQYVRIFFNGFIDGIVRPKNKGGDLITIVDPSSHNNGNVYKVLQVLGEWDPGWTEVAAVLQDNS